MIDKSNFEHEVAQIKTIIEQTNLVRTTKWGADVYTYKDKNVLSVVGFKNHFTIWFYNGVFLSDKHKVLSSSADGKTKSLRQWRFTSADQIDDTKILDYINEAIKNEERGLRLKPAKFEAVEPAPLLTAAIAEDLALKSAFEKLTPGRQKEYNLFLNDAKQDVTKSKRVEKIIPLILQGVGLHDKYK